MPNKTIYVRDVDLPLFDTASEELGESVSALFASFLRERLAAMTSKERQAVQLMKRIRQDRERREREGGSTVALSEIKQAEAYALKVLEAVRKQDYESARNLWFGANFCHATAHRSASQYQKIRAEIGRILRGSSGSSSSGGK